MHGAAAIHDCHATQPRTRGTDGLYCEDDWNDVSTLEAEPYWLSKVGGCAAVHMLSGARMHACMHGACNEPADTAAIATRMQTCVTPERHQNLSARGWAGQQQTHHAMGSMIACLAVLA